jgi:hypothetical protein
MKLQPIQDISGFKKDEQSNAILAVDSSSLVAYKKMKATRNVILNDINNIKNELGEIRDMLKLIISSNKGS